MSRSLEFRPTLGFVSADLGSVIAQVPRRIYAKNPIVEALCEFRFSAPTEGWIFVPYRLHEKLADLFPSEPTTDAPAFAPTVGGVLGQAIPSVQVVVGIGGSGRIKMASADGKSTLIASSQSLAVNMLDPYSGWERFSETLKRVLAAFTELTNGEFSIERIGLRYINRVSTPVKKVSDYFSLSPLSFDGLDLVPATFVSRSELKFSEDGARVLIATFAKGVEASVGDSVILDLDVVAQGLTDVNDSRKAFDIVLELRDVEKRAFESAITEKARLDLFGGYVEENGD